MEISRKITIGGINGLTGGFKNVKETRHVARIYGRASEGKAKDGGAMGISFEFSGEFIGVNEDGEETTAPKCYLIAPADQMLMEALKKADGAAVDFAFDFYVAPKESAVLGYEYKVKPVIAVEKSQPLLALASKFGDNPGPQKKQLAIEGTSTEESDKATETQAIETAKTNGKKK